MPKNNWSIQLDKFNAGFAPLAFTDSLTEEGGGGHASSMKNVDVLTGKLTQGPGLADLTNGTQAGNVTEQIQFIMDRATADDVSWAFGSTKLFKISSTTVENGTAVSGCTEGESLLALKGNLYGFYNKSTGGDIFKMPLSTETVDPNWGSTVPTGGAVLEKAPHPSAKKEDIMVFGNGQYAGTFINETNTLTPQKLDFGDDAQVDDVIFNSGYWYLVVNSGATGTNRTEGQIFLYDGSAVPSTLSDETGVGVQRIGFLYRINGIIYVAYQDLTSTGFIIGFIQGKSIVPLQRYTGALPTFAQKTLYKNTILFLSSGLAYTAGAFVPELPYQLSQHADGGYGTVGAVASPFGTPMISSTDGGSNFRLAQFSGFDTNCEWQSIVFPVSLGKFKGYIDEIIVLTESLGSGASCVLTVEANQEADTSNSLTIETTSKRRHYFTGTGLGQIEDFLIKLDWSGGSTTNACPIRKIRINGQFVQTT